MDLKQILMITIQPKDSYRGIDFGIILNKLIKSNVYLQQTREDLYKMCKAALVYCPSSTFELLSSDDNDTVELGIQMLFIEHIDLFNQALDNEFLKTEIYSYIKRLMQSLKFIKTQIAYDK